MLYCQCSAIECCIAEQCSVVLPGPTVSCVTNYSAVTLAATKKERQPQQMLPELAPKIHWLFVNNSLISRESLKSWVLNLFSLFLCPQSFFSAWLKTANSLQLCTINLGPIASFIDIFEQVIDRPKPCLSCVCITVKSFGQSDCTHKCKTLLQTFLFYHQLFYQSKGLCC